MGLGVEPITGKPYKPNTHGKNERFHQALFRHLDKQLLAGSVAELQSNSAGLGVTSPECVESPPRASWWFADRAAGAPRPCAAIDLVPSPASKRLPDVCRDPVFDSEWSRASAGSGVVDAQRKAEAPARHWAIDPLGHPEVAFYGPATVTATFRASGAGLIGVNLGPAEMTYRSPERERHQPGTEGGDR